MALSVIAAATGDISSDTITKMARDAPNDSLIFCLDTAPFYYCEQLLTAIKSTVDAQYFRLSILSKVSDIMTKFARFSDASKIPEIMTIISLFNKFL